MNDSASESVSRCRAAVIRVGTIALLACSGATAPGSSTPFHLQFVTIGGDHSCGLTPSGVAYCWGDPYLGELGNGVRGNGNEVQSVPVPVVGGQSFMSLSAGGAHSCGITASGAAYCWGYNEYGRLGVGDTSMRLTPTAVLGSIQFQEVVAGGEHSCGLSLAGQAYCWGYNGSGELGDSTLETRLSPVPVSGGLVFKSLAIGTSGVCGLTYSGVAYCWGSNSSGQLGDSTLISRWTPTRVAGGITFSLIRIAEAHTCALTAAGLAYCWGRTAHTPTDTVTLVPRVVSLSLSFSDLAAGPWGTCGLSGTEIYCWGFVNSNGVLGDGTTTSHGTPEPVLSSVQFGALASSGPENGHMCALSVDGVAYCWGGNGSGQLGDGTRTDRWVPTLVRSP